MAAGSAIIATVAVLTIAADRRGQLLETARRLAQALAQADDYRIVGGVAVILPYEQDPMAARSTRDVDITVGAQLRAIAVPSAVRLRVPPFAGSTCW
jgi:hypothetical protein